MAIDLLKTVIPFRFLTEKDRASLREDAREHHFAKEEVIIAQGDVKDDRIYFIEEGLVETRDASQSLRPPLNQMEAGQYFGERAALFAEGRSFEIRAIEQTRCLSIPGERFLQLLQSSRSFAQALGDILRGKQNILVAVDQFLAELLHGVSAEKLHLRHILPFYLALEPALHSKANLDNEIDLGGLTYAVRRLPENITCTFSYFLTNNLPELYREPDRSFRFIKTPARPRSVYEMLPGKSMILLRDGLSDLIDLITCLCLYTVEARKIRKRLRFPTTLQYLQGFQVVDMASSHSVTKQNKTALESLPFSTQEIEGLATIWPENLVRRLYEIAIHHEDFGIEISKKPDNYNIAHSQRWTTQIAEATQSLIGCDPGEMPEEISVHIISSNTHSVANCLSSYLTDNATDILAWGQQNDLINEEENWANQQDLVYSLARRYFVTHQEEAKQKREIERASGMLRLSETAFTGIEVQLFDTVSICQRSIDKDVTRPPTGNRSLLVNIDFAFGQQAEEIIGNLLMLFGKRIASINILGKAGALLGKRGDILCPSSFIEQTVDLLHQLPQEKTVSLASLQKRVPDRSVYKGPLLTVAGTLLQNRRMLHFYRHLWSCVGLEMEGAFYYRQILESVNLGVVSNDIALRFLYYVSDLPLDTHSNLAGRMSAFEGIPPLYAITREILSGIFTQAKT